MTAARPASTTAVSAQEAPAGRSDQRSAFPDPGRQGERRPRRPGRYVFHCGSNMYFGEIVAT